MRLEACSAVFSLTLSLWHMPPLTLRLTGCGDQVTVLSCSDRWLPAEGRGGVSADGDMVNLHDSLDRTCTMKCISFRTKTDVVSDTLRISHEALRRRQ